MQIADNFKKNSILIIAGNSVTGFGNSMYLVALLTFVSTRLPHPANIGLLQAAAYLPIVFFSVPAGFFADRAKRVPIIAGGDLLRSLFLSLSAVSLLTLPTAHPLLIILPMVFLNGIMQAFFMPAVISFVLDYQKYALNYKDSSGKDRRRPDLLSLRTGSGHLSSLLGQTLGAGLYVVLGIVPILLMNAATFLISGISELFLSDSRTEKPVDVGKPSLKGLFLELRNAESRNAPVLLYLAAQAAGAAILVNLPFFLTERLSFPPSYLGFAMAALFAGSILSGVSLGFRSKRPSPRSGYIAALISAVSLIGTSLLPGAYRPALVISFLALLAVSGAGMGWLHIVTIHQVYRISKPETAASRQGFLEAAATAVLPVSYLLSGFIFEQLPLDTPWIMRSVGACIFILSCFFLIRRRRIIRNP